MGGGVHEFQEFWQTINIGRVQRFPIAEHSAIYKSDWWRDGEWCASVGGLARRNAIDAISSEPVLQCDGRNVDSAFSCGHFAHQADHRSDRATASNVT